MKLNLAKYATFVDTFVNNDAPALAKQAQIVSMAKTAVGLKKTAGFIDKAAEKLARKTVQVYPAAASRPATSKYSVNNSKLLSDNSFSL